MSSPDSTPDPTAVAKAMHDQVAASLAGTLMERMEIRIDEVSPDRIVASMPVAGNTQPYGLLHGGASAVIAESIGSMGAAIHGAQYGRVPVGIELSCTHHRAARTGRVTAVGVPISSGRTLATWEIVVSDEDDNRICTARLTCLLREGPPGS